jgi:hypothetical protein
VSPRSWSCFFTRSGLALARSILLIAMTIFTFAALACAGRLPRRDGKERDQH